MNKLTECPCCGYPHDDVEAQAMNRILNKIKADAVRSIMDETESWAVMNTYAVTVEDIHEYADKLERGE